MYPNGLWSWAKTGTRRWPPSSLYLSVPHQVRTVLESLRVDVLWSATGFCKLDRTSRRISPSFLSWSRTVLASFKPCPYRRHLGSGVPKGTRRSTKTGNNCRLGLVLFQYNGYLTLVRLDSWRDRWSERFSGTGRSGRTSCRSLRVDPTKDHWWRYRVSGFLGQIGSLSKMSTRGWSYTDGCWGVVLSRTYVSGRRRELTVWLHEHIHPHHLERCDGGMTVVTYSCVRLG